MSAQLEPKMNLDILYEDDDLVAVSKPAGVLVHADGRPATPAGPQTPACVVDWFLEHYPESAGVGEPNIETDQGTTIRRPGVIHRLDKDTSGVLLLAKTDEGHAQAKAQFQNRQVQKVYRAFVYGQMKEDSYEVTAPIGRAKHFGRLTAIPKAARGTLREAETEIIVLDRFWYEDQPFSYIEARPKTGRTHQIRVHLQYLNYPIVADPLYAGKRFIGKDGADSGPVRAAPENLNFTRQALHAYELRFKNLAGEEITAQSPLPPEFQK